MEREDSSINLSTDRTNSTDELDEYFVMAKEIHHLLPSNYTLPEFIREGGFGAVFKCVKVDTNETVAVKIPKRGVSLYCELSLMNKFKRTNLDERNVVRFIDSFELTDRRTALVFEFLDTTLYEYLIERETVTVHDIRSIVQQLASAFDVLKTFGVIHADLKFDNIMVVDRKAQPIRVKLIDFGLAVLTYRVKRGKSHQIVSHRAPEIILGLPYSEAIDMWSLGVVMGRMVLGQRLFPGTSEYDVLRYMVELLGLPPRHLLKAGMYSTKCFVKRPSHHWRLKTPREHESFSVSNSLSSYKRNLKSRNLDDLETFPLNLLTEVEADEKMECIDLLKAMLAMNANERITPSQVLAHPFITGEPRQQSAGTNETSGTAVLSAEPSQTESSASSEDATCSTATSGLHRWTPDPLHPSVILVRPALGEQSPVERPPPVLKVDHNMKREEVPPTTSDDMEPKKKTKKKKKNCFKRFFSWAKRTFCCCITVPLCVEFESSHRVRCTGFLPHSQKHAF